MSELWMRYSSWMGEKKYRPPSSEELLAVVRRGVESGTIKGEEVCGEEVETYDGPFLCGHVEDEEIHHPVHGHKFVPSLVIPVSDGGSET